MAALIDWGTTGAIFGESLAAGVIIAAAFAWGARLVAVGTDARHEGRSAAGSFAIAVFCFLIAAAAVGYGVYFTIDK
jgi:hypothetical protein